MKQKRRHLTETIYSHVVSKGECLCCPIFCGVAHFAEFVGINVVHKLPSEDLEWLVSRSKSVEQRELLLSFLFNQSQPTKGYNFQESLSAVRMLCSPCWWMQDDSWSVSPLACAWNSHSKTNSWLPSEIWYSELSTCQCNQILLVKVAVRWRPRYVVFRVQG